MSAKELNFPTTNYKPENYPVTTYEDAKKGWDDRIGSASKQAYNWRLFALGTLLISIILAIGLIIQSTKSQIKPYRVNMYADGSAQAVGPVPEYIPQEPEIKYFLSQFVQKTRTMPIDPIVWKQNWLSAYGFLTQVSAVKMNELIKKENLSAKLGSETRQVDINSIVPLSEKTYQIRWKEIRFTSQGGLIENYSMIGIFTIIFIEPKNEKAIINNPLGLYIQDFSLSKDQSKELN